MSNDMLGAAVKKLVALPEDRLGLAYDLLMKLGDPVWVSPSGRFLRGENPWPTAGQIDLAYLTLLPEAVADIPAVRATKRFNPFAAKSDDPSSPFGYCELTVALAPGRNKKAFRAQGYRLAKDQTFAEMVTAVGGKEATERHIFNPAQVRAMVDRQSRGEAGPLLTNGYANFFFVRAANRSLAVANVHWRVDFGYWFVWSAPLSYSVRWFTERRLFLRT